ncbi:hypothetical protein [Kitasatospora fiedleri]|uniref:hypothetical protein n=1 Tax=Kitasatospora fiedleri TaxID=2991545 RepID=UPI00249AF099|nr:hypothetical protein [Kitasatospora fiedleri]
MQTIMPGRSARIEFGTIAALQQQFQGQVLALVAQDLATIEPEATVATVVELASRVWEQTTRHAASAARTGWDHISWFVADVLAARRTQIVGC